MLAAGGTDRKRSRPSLRVFFYFCTPPGSVGQPATAMLAPRLAERFYAALPSRGFVRLPPCHREYAACYASFPPRPACPEPGADKSLE
jgi:hypothetical protein